jgi:flagellar basal body rod protein FlgG
MLGIAVGVAGTHVALSGRANPNVRLPQLSIGSRFDAPAPHAEMPALDTLPELQTAFAPPPSTVHAIATAPAEIAPTEAIASEPPRPLLNIDGAEPLSAEQPREDAELRAFIRDELQTLAASEHDVWYETLRDLSREDATEILRIWKLTRGVASGPISPELKQFCAMPIEKLVTHPPVAETAPAPRQSRTATLADSHRLWQLNLANAATPGFKRRELMIFEQTGTAAIEGSSRPLTEIWINVAQGPLTNTQRLLDCAINGQGFFQVRRDKDALLTRCGRFVLDDENRIALPRSHGAPCPLEPAIKVPNDCERLQIQLTGEVTAVVKGAPAQSLGTISLFNVLDPAALEPVGDNLFGVTTTSGPATRMTEGERGKILQGVIEESNVDPAAERRTLEALSILNNSL